MALKTKSIKRPKEDADGWRISVMSRHTLDDGKTPDSDIMPETYNEHCSKLGPHSTLIGTYKRGQISWKVFEQKFRDQMKSPQMQSRLRSLATLALTFDVTILCVEESPEHCHRRLIAETCKAIEPSLELFIE